MSRLVPVSDTLSIYPSGYTGCTFTTSTNASYRPENGYGDVNSTTRARLQLASTNTSYVIYYTFDCSAIPANATINSVSGSFSAYVSNTSRVTNTQARLYAGSTAKGSNTTFATASTTDHTFNLSPGSS
jgi:hypothetical protein